MNISITDEEMRLALLKKLPLFAQFSNSTLSELANAFHDVVYPEHQLIVEENEIVDSVYVIVEGNAEVSCQDQHSKKPKKDILAVLHAGEAIGLSDIGFFSTTGVRSATVTALTPVLTIRLELADFKCFMERHPDSVPDMHKVADKMLRLQFIKQAEPFAAINPQVLARMVERIKEQEIDAGTVIFRQGDPADCCYLLCSGTLNVVFTTTHGSEEILAKLHPGALVGELALLTDSTRNATVVAETPCKLLSIKRDAFQQLVQQSMSSLNALTAMMMDRFRPKWVDGITIHTRQSKKNKIEVILKNEEKGEYFQTNKEGLWVFQMLDGEHTLKDIAIAFFYQFHKLATDDIGHLVLSLMHAGFVKAPLLNAYIPQPRLPLWLRILIAFRNILQYEYSMKSVDQWITHLYQRIGYLFFTKTAQFVMALLSISGALVFASFLNQAAEVLSSTPNAWLLLLLIGPANLFVIPFHELAHALATKAYGYKVNRLGIGWFWFGPIAFADTSDMWLSTRGPRMVVNLAGIYVNVVISGILSLIGFASVLSYPTLAAFLWMVALSSYLVAFYNLDPIFELDGYYVLMDALEKPNLRTHAIQWLMQDAKKTLFNRLLLRQYLPEILYWITSILFIFVSACMAYLVQAYVINNILPATIGQVHLAHFKWFLSLLVVVFAIVILYGKIKQEQDKVLLKRPI